MFASPPSAFFIRFDLIPSRQVETITQTAHQKTTVSLTRVHDLRDRIAQLKLRFTENEIKVRQAEEAVRDADQLASRAELVRTSSEREHPVCVNFRLKAKKA